MPIRKIRGDYESDDEMGAPSVKHVKLNNVDAETNGEEASEASEASEVEEEGQESIPEIRNLELKPLAIDSDGFVEGSIVKITLTNFVTYDYCEIAPGPDMNMIIGPNGTGKSTIVCAIALGLGGSPALLGRAKDINEFVKTGEDEATIMIELKKVGTRNVIIQRNFRKTSKTNNWRLNGKNCAYKDVLAIVHSFNIQVDNLCQFLPQDRVAEFAELTPALLLQRTQAAAGKAELHEMQQKLVQIRDTEKTLMKTHESDLSHLKTMKTKNQELERDVLRMQQREKIVNNIKLLEAQVPLVKYTESKAKYDIAETEYNAEKEKYQKAKAEVAPVKVLVDQIANEKRRANRDLVQADTIYRTSVTKVRQAAEQINKKRAEISGHQSSIIDKKNKIPEREEEIKKAIKRIQLIEEQVTNKPSSDTTQFETAIDQINEEINTLQSKKDDIKRKSDNEKRQILKMNNDYDIIDKKIKHVENMRQLRLDYLHKSYPDIALASNWLKKNKSKFVGEVYDPAILLIKPKDTRYASQVEHALGGFRSSHLRQFICEKKEDYDLMTRVCVDQQKMKVVISWPNLNPSINYRRNPAPLEDIKAKLGMDYYISDLIEGPKYVVDTLCFNTFVNRIPVSLNPINEKAVVDSGLFQKFIVGKSLNEVKASNYGKRIKQVKSTSVRKSQFLCNTIDTQTQINMNETMRSLKASVADARKIVEEMSHEGETFNAKLEEKKHAKEDQQSQKRDVQKRVQSYEQQMRKLGQYKEELAEKRKRPEEEKAEIARIEKVVIQATDQEDNLLVNQTKHMEKVIELFEQRNKAAMLSHFIDAKNSAIESYAKSQTENLNNAHRAVEKTKDQYLAAKRETKQYMDAAKNAGNDLPDELREQFNEIICKWKEGKEGLQVTLDDLNSNIAQEKGKVEAIRYANPDAMSHYQETKQTIEALEAKANQTRHTLDNYRKQIQTIKDQWAPLIKELVSRIDEKFSAAFKRINCAGAVQLAESEDFDKWGINILVKFRDTEKLQLLTGQRQSGGERSVSTILYLMSLQDLAASPFRVVDEINQGMDPRNERMIHEQIVQSATRAGTSQYFLITPKLLPDLYYNERMRVLCIYNSEWLPEKIKPLQAYLDQAKE